MLSLNAKLQEFRSNPFYSFFSGVLQAESDAAVVAIVSGFKVRDKIAILEREQTIGAAPTYLRFSQLVEELRQQLTEQIKKTQDGPQ